MKFNNFMKFPKILSFNLNVGIDPGFHVRGREGWVWGLYPQQEFRGH